MAEWLSHQSIYQMDLRRCYPPTASHSRLALKCKMGPIQARKQPSLDYTSSVVTRPAYVDHWWPDRRRSLVLMLGKTAVGGAGLTLITELADIHPLLTRGEGVILLIFYVVASHSTLLPALCYIYLQSPPTGVGGYPLAGSGQPTALGRALLPWRCPGLSSNEAKYPDLSRLVLFVGFGWVKISGQ